MEPEPVVKVDLDPVGEAQNKFEYYSDELNSDNQEPQDNNSEGKSIINDFEKSWEDPVEWADISTNAVATADQLKYTSNLCFLKSFINLINNT